jgi:hypothetical protein
VAASTRKCTARPQGQVCGSNGEPTGPFGGRRSRGVGACSDREPVGPSDGLEERARDSDGTFQQLSSSTCPSSVQQLATKPHGASRQTTVWAQGQMP